MVTDYDCWHPNHDNVTVDQIVNVLLANADKARTLVKSLIPKVAKDLSADACSCRSALEHALLTPPQARDQALLRKLDAVAGRILSKG
jgi:5'-methylthioadenosine phosphorylase